MIRIVLADDHTLVRAGVRALLSELSDVQIVGECADGRTALRLVESEKPDIIIMDIGMPELNGLDAAARIAESVPSTRVVLLSMHSNERYVARALSVGVAAYVLKDATTDELPLLIRSVMQGEVYLSPGISRRVVDVLRGHLDKEKLDPLTVRQREILQLLAEGKNTKEIGHLLGVSAKTVETHRAQIMDRLGIRDIPGLVRYAIRIGLIEPE